MTGFLLSLLSQFGGYIAAGAVALLGLVGAYFKIRSDAVKGEKLKQAQANEALNAQYQEIDGHPIDPGAAYGNLRKRLHDDPSGG